MNKALHTTKTLAILLVIYAITSAANAHPYLILDNNTDNICFAPPYSIKSCPTLRLSYTLIKNFSLMGSSIKKPRNALQTKTKRQQTAQCEPIKPINNTNSLTKMLTLIPNLKLDLDVLALTPDPSSDPFFGVSINFRRCW